MIDEARRHEPGTSPQSASNPVRSHAPSGGSASNGVGPMRRRGLTLGSATARLLQEGTASVVAMAYSVYAVAAAEFMAAFYERLFAGDRVADAVSAGRRRLVLQQACRALDQLGDRSRALSCWGLRLQRSPAGQVPCGEEANA